MPLFQHALQLQLVIKSDKSQYYGEKIDSNVDNPKKMWKVLNDLTSKKSKQTLINHINLDGTSYTKSADIADAFNTHLTQISGTLSSEYATGAANPTFEDFITPATSIFRFTPVSILAVTNLMKNLCQ